MIQRVVLVLILFLLGSGTGVVAKDTPLLSNPTVGGDLLTLDWRVYIAAKPVYCILVEKDRQLLRVLRHDGRVQVVAEYVAGTGENFGRKEVEGDAKTPEGVYLITKSYLDRKMSVFGTRSFHLNYPNYFDIQDGRTGNGIFIHGTNRPLRATSSNGCVTMDNEDLANLAGFLDLNTPIFIVPSLANLHDAAEYPNLTERDFAGAKAMLIPGEEGPAEFASLYLININDQTVVVGEYWPGQGSDLSLRKAIAYIQRTQDGRWFVADRGSTGEASSAADTAMTVAGHAAWSGALAGMGDEEIDSIPTVEKSVFREPSLAETYLSWRQESSRPAVELLSSNLPQEPEAAPGQGQRDGLIYGMFFLATLVSICSALFMIRRQGVRMGGTGIVSSGEMTPSALEVDHAVILQEQVRQAVEMLHSVRDQIDKETKGMERQEALESRIGILEEGFQSRQDTIVALAAAQALLQQERGHDQIGREEMVADLRLDVGEVKRQLEEAHQEMTAFDARDGQVYQQLAEITQLLMEQSSAFQVGRQESKDVQMICAQLHGRVHAMAEVLERSEQNTLQDDAREGQDDDKTLATLQAYAVELATIREEIASLRLVSETKTLEEVLQGLRRDNEKREVEGTEIKEVRSILESLSSALLSEKTVKASFEAEAAAREQEIRSLREAGERVRRGAESELSALKTKIEEFEAREEAARREQEELLLQLQQAYELKAVVAAREEEARSLREAGERVRSASESELSALKTKIEEFEAREEAARCEQEALLLQLRQVDELRAEVAAREQEITSLREARDAESRREQEELLLQRQKADELRAEVAAREQEITSLREARDAESRREQEELLLQRQQADELKSEIAAREEEITMVRERGGRQKEEAAAKRRQMEANLAEVVLARQVETTHLTHALKVAEERVLAERELAAELSRSIEAVREDLRQVMAREDSSEQQLNSYARTISELNDENTKLKEQIREIGKRSTGGESPALVKGASSPALPDAVLRKWMAKGQ